MTDDEVYSRVGRLLTEAPAPEDLSDMRFSDILRWVGQAVALAEHTGAYADAVTLTLAVPKVTTGELYSAYWTTLGVLNTMLARAEIKASPAVTGSFIAAGQEFDAFSAVAKVFGDVVGVIRIVDPYMDEKTLTHFAVLLPDQVRIELLTDAGTMKPALLPAVRAWSQQYDGARLLDARKSPPRQLHDRAIFLDGSTVWTVSQSFNALAARSPATLTKLNPETASLKLAAYDQIWAASQPI